ncbi:MULTISPECIES: hypothetical protein [unclassified Pedobacter]|uniref:hypothetical protein n=1 Tax=unclassified Pedobacter TaxID=2628915 RepID=UPI001E3D2F9C|nr:MULTISPECIES: hypothetical protein [unclassified Pedobacter]
MENKNWMIFKLAPQKFNEISKLVDLNVETLTVLTEITEEPVEFGAIFLKKSNLEVMLEEYEKSLDDDI